MPKKPTKSEKRRRDQNVSIWVDADERGELEKAAKAADDMLSTWVRKAALRAARAEAR